MAVEKVTPMLLTVDLQCPACYKKIKKTLCKLPEVRDQVYNEKTNTVAITVITCCPERVRDRLYGKAGKVIKEIKIVEHKKPEKGKLGAEQEKKEKDSGAEAEKPKEDKPKEKEKDKEESEKPKDAPADGVPSVLPYMAPTYDGYRGMPSYLGYGFPPPPPQPIYEGYSYYPAPETGYYQAPGPNMYGYRPVYNNGFAPFHRNFSEEENSGGGCSIM